MCSLFAHRAGALFANACQDLGSTGIWYKKLGALLAVTVGAIRRTPFNRLVGIFHAKLFRDEVGDLFRVDD